VEILRRTVKTRLNLEMAATDEMVGIALKLHPDSVTLVPEKRAELTTEGGLDVVQQRPALVKPIDLLRQAGIVVSLFIDPDLEQIKAAHRLGADVIEIHTGNYCDAVSSEVRRNELARIEAAVRGGRKLGLGISAGHGLDYRNVSAVVTLGGIEEYNIGHSIVSRAVLVGMEQAVREMVALVRGR
jgi:pyridoxine 5-phosphate synthase